MDIEAAIESEAHREEIVFLICGHMVDTTLTLPFGVVSIA